MLDSNPFTYGSMIGDPARFVGRRAELAIITGRLNGTQPQGTAIFGPRRIGKSSLLQYLYQPLATEKLCAAPQQRLIYFSPEGNACASPAAFLTILMKAILSAAQPIDGRTRPGRNLDELDQQLQGGATCTWEQARTLLSELNKIPLHPVVCLDEFESLMTPTFDDNFFNSLRNWQNEGLLTWITASARSLPDLKQLYNRTSPFFNLLANVPIQGLLDAEVDELLNQANDTVHPFNPKERALIRKLAGNHPYHLQIVCWRLWQEKAQGRTTDYAALRRFLCQQPAPPASCEPKPAIHPGWRAALGLLVVLLGLLGLWTWRHPDEIKTVLQSCWAWLTWAMPYFATIGNTGQLIGGIIFMLVGLGVVVTGIRQRKWPWQIARDLWQRWQP